MTAMSARNRVTFDATIAAGVEAATHLADVAVLVEPMPWTGEVREAVRQTIVGDIDAMLTDPIAGMTHEMMAEIRASVASAFDSRVTELERNGARGGTA